MVINMKINTNNKCIKIAINKLKFFIFFWKNPNKKTFKAKDKNNIIIKCEYFDKITNKISITNYITTPITIND